MDLQGIKLGIIVGRSKSWVRIANVNLDDFDFFPVRSAELVDVFSSTVVGLVPREQLDKEVVFHVSWICN
jgi:hypothetical protein